MFYIILYPPRASTLLRSRSIISPLDPPQIMFDVSTSSLDLVNFTLSTSIVEQFYLQLNKPASLTVSPSAPAVSG